jgi:hypothetical protein
MRGLGVLADAIRCVFGEGDATASTCIVVSGLHHTQNSQTEKGLKRKVNTRSCLPNNKLWLAVQPHGDLRSADTD